MRKSYTLRVILFAFFFTSCGEHTSSTTGEDGESHIQKVSSDANGPAAETIDTMSPGKMTGTYSGNLPCGDCEGIKTALSLKRDDTFVLNTEYLGKNTTDIQVVGTYSYDDQSNIITLENAADGPSKFLYENGGIWILDQNANRIEGEYSNRYLLTKNFE
jgi:uncharacterized lipoprotein NlpE involved in copper resistance